MTHARISIDPAVMMGKPCIKGTRVTVELILRKLGAGRSFADLLEAYPRLTEDDLRAALAFVADYMRNKNISPDELRARLEHRPGMNPSLPPAQAVRAERDRQ
jgi:uncharacterized protein (DUF433 family)